MILDTTMLCICEKINTELQTERFNTRMVHIARCFQYDHFLGVDTKMLQKDRFYYNDYFNLLYGMKLDELEQCEIKMFQITKDYGESITRDCSE